MTRLDSFALVFLPLLKLVRGSIARFPVKISWIADLRSMGPRPQSGAALRERYTRRRHVGPSRVPRQLYAAFTFRGTHSTLPSPPDAPRARRVDPSGAQREALCEPFTAPPPASYCVVAGTSPSKSPVCRIS